jgi:asparagine synthase (glutamine-hydrolysing)
MILGSLSFSTGENGSSAINTTRELTPSEAIFHQVNHGDFTGGYYLHPRLPYTSADFYCFDEVNDILVLLSGSVYNKAELLLKCNITTKVPDPELIVRLFMLEGPGFVKNLNGDFALFIGQPRNKQAYLFRDHVGMRPLVWTTDKQTLFFSSDIVGLCRIFSNGQPIDSEYLLRYFKFIDYRKTPDERVKKLLPGHYLHFSEKGIKMRKFWEPEKIRIDKTLSYDKMLADLKTILWDAVKIRCDHRFNAGAHVSSGLDSGIVSTLARKEYANQVDFYGFSWSPGDFVPVNVKYDERDIVLKSCEKTNIKPLFSGMKGTDFPRIVSSFYYNHGFFSEDNTAEQAVKVNTNLIFSGWGGDEFVSTGDRGIELDLLLGLKLRTFFRRNSVNHPKKFVKYLLLFVLFPALGILDGNTKKSFRDDARYIKNRYKQSDRIALRNFYFHITRHQLHLRMLRFYHLQERCESWAINDYRKGVEYRYPLLDRRTIEYILKVPSELLCKTDHFRPLLREISEGVLPDEVRWNLNKNDPVYWAYMDELFKEAALQFMEEVNEWKADPDLNFVDFDLLTKDIVKYNDHPDKTDTKVLFRALVYIKGIHEFTVTYRGGMRNEA